MHDKQIVLHQGVYKPVASVAEAVFMITGMTIGAGVLGIPYVVAQVGLGVGLIYIFVLGIVMLFLNLMIGEIAVRTKEHLQLPGFAGKYLGRTAKSILSITIIFSSIGALLAYMVGEGQALATLFGGTPAWWSVFFWSLCSFVVWRGLDMAKSVEKVFSLLVISIIVGLSLYFFPNIKWENVTYFNPLKIFLPYGVILFALHASPAIAEAHALLPGSQRHFRKALIIGTLIPVAVYMLFALAVVGVGGLSTTEIATVGLSSHYGRGVLFFANLFAAFAMCTGFVGLGIALKQTLVWDHKIPHYLAALFVITAPLVLFMFGWRSFVGILDTVGGLFIGVEAVLMVLIYWQAKRKGDLPAPRYNLNYFWLIAVPVLLVFSAASVISVIKLIQ